MTEKLPLIVSVKEREPTKVSAEGRPFEEFEVDTTDGPMLLQLTSKATDDLRGMLNTALLNPEPCPLAACPRSERGVSGLP